VNGDFGQADQPGAGDRRHEPSAGYGSRGAAPDLRVSDADRDRAAAELSEHFQAGRLTQDEFDERVGKAISARTRADLDALLADLPAHQPAENLPAAAPAGQVARNLRWVAPWVMVASAVLIFAVTAGLPRSHGHWAPWWLIPLAFLVLRRLAWRGGRPPGRWR